MGGIVVKPMFEQFGAEVGGIGTGRALDDRTCQALRHLLHEHGLLVFRDLDITPDQHVALARALGPLAIHIQRSYLVPGHPELVRVSNIFEDGKPIGLRSEEVEWHVDGSWSREPSAASLLYCIRAAAEGGDTLFASTQFAYDTLPPALRLRIGKLHAVHSLEHVNERKRLLDPHRPALSDEQRRQAPDVVHPLVRTHPVTGRRSLLVGSMVIRRIIELPPADGAALLEQLLEHATRECHIYRHRWQPGDLVCWDNATMLHTGTPCGPSPRLLHRATVLGPWCKDPR